MTEGTVRVSFFGHRVIKDPIWAEEFVRTVVRSLIERCSYVEFLVGRNGDLDLMVAAVVREMKQTLRSDNSALIWVMPYVTRDFRDNEAEYLAYYDQVEVCPAAEEAHYKRALLVRNREMVERSSLCFFYLDHCSGGAYETYRYARLRRRPALNFYRESKEEQEKTRDAWASWVQDTSFDTDSW